MIEQKEWLMSKLAQFVASRRSETLHSEFWAGIYEEWFQKWPIEGDGVEDSKRRKAVSIEIVTGSDVALTLEIISKSRTGSRITAARALEPAKGDSQCLISA